MIASDRRSDHALALCFTSKLISSGKQPEPILLYGRATDHHSKPKAQIFVLESLHFCGTLLLNTAAGSAHRPEVRQVRNHAADAIVTEIVPAAHGGRLRKPAKLFAV